MSNLLCVKLVNLLFFFLSFSSLSSDFAKFNRIKWNMSFRTWLKRKLKHKHSLWCGSLWNQKQPWIGKLSGNCLMAAALTEHTHKPQLKRIGFRFWHCHGGPCSTPGLEQSGPAQFTLRFFNFFLNANIKKIKQQEKYRKKQKQPLLYQALAGNRTTAGMLYLTFGTVCRGFLLTASPFPIYDFSSKCNNEKNVNNSNSKSHCTTCCHEYLPTSNNQVFVVLSKYD